MRQRCFPGLALCSAYRHSCSMGEMLIGTSGYSYDDWRGILYPESLPKEEFLRYYALFFPFVELNFSYYAMPKASSLVAMVAKTPSGFCFSVKAHRSLTHEPGSTWRDDAAVFVEALAPMSEADRLLTVLVQLPYSFHHTPENRSYLASLLSALSPLPLAVEFRNDEWQTERVFDELERRGVGVVMVDRPELPGLPPLGDRVTGDLAYVRFHGRNAGAWWSGDATSRYDYLYSVDELAVAVPRLRRMAKAERVLIAFNNHARGNAVRNARELKSIISPT
jgi:uncharacterized protein YecE (DUF72 family)